MRTVYHVCAIVLLASIFTFAQSNPVPLVNQPLIPDKGVPGANGLTLTVNGTGFVSGATVNWNGSARATAFFSTSRLSATILASDIAKPGTAMVTVVNPGPGGGVSNWVSFPVMLPVYPEFTEGAFAAGSAAAVVITADFNRDGRLDVAVGNFNDGTVSVLLGQGDGTFKSAVTYAAGPAPVYGMAVGDFNNDGNPDLAVVVNNDSVSVLLGNGDGTFQAFVNYGAHEGANGVSVGDFNADGKLDLVVSNSASNDVSILLGNGDGTFEEVVNYPSGGSAVGDIAVNDLNGDGKLDLAVANQGGGPISVLLGNGDGTLQAAVNYQVGSSPHGVVAADLNGDGRLDLAVPNNISGDVSILLGNGDGTFQPALNYAAGSGPNSIAVGDFNGDGILDLLVADAFSNTVSILLGNGNGTFQAAVAFSGGSNSNAAVPGDFNGDGKLDVAIADLSSGAVDILLQDGTVSLAPTALNFAARLIGSRSAGRNVLLTNVGKTALNISSIAVTGSDVQDFPETTNCPSSLAPHAHCVIVVSFQPSQTGLRTASVTITDDAPGSPQTLSVTGVGLTSGPNATLSPMSLNFGNVTVGSTSSQQSTLVNYGTGRLSVSDMKVTGADSQDFAETDNCPRAPIYLASMQACTITVTFTPPTVGTFSAGVTVYDNAPGSPQTLSVSGNGVQQSRCSCGGPCGYLCSLKHCQCITASSSYGSTGRTNDPGRGWNLNAADSPLRTGQDSCSSQSSMELK